MADRYAAMQLWPKTAIAYETRWDDTAMMQGTRGRYIWGAPVQPNLPDSQAGAVQQRPDEPHGKVDDRHVLGADGRLVSTVKFQADLAAKKEMNLVRRVRTEAPW